MKRLAGQAGLVFGRLLHLLGMLLLTVISLLGLLAFILAFRLSEGPIQVPYLASELATAVSGRGIRIDVGQAVLAWGGFKNGGAAPLYLRLGRIVASNAVGVELATVPDARLLFLPGALLGTKAPILVNSADAHFAGSAVSVSMEAAIRLGLGLHLSSADLFITLGAGNLGSGDNSVPITGGGFSAHVTPDDLAIDNGRLSLAPQGESAPAVAFSGGATRQADWRGQATITVDAVQAVDLSAYWPPGLAAQTRQWVVKNITAGQAHDGRFTLGLSAPADLSRLALTAAAGGFAADGLTLSWIPGAVPITALNGTLTIVDPDDISITASRARLGGLALSQGVMKITGIAHHDQAGALTLNADGRVADAIAVLNAPPLSLFRALPADVALATGAAHAAISVELPFKTDLKIQQVTLNVDAGLSNVAMPVPIGGLAFSNGVLAMHVTTQVLNLSGTASLAGEAARVTALADFGTGQPLRRFTLKTAVGPAFLHHYGLDAATSMADAVTGTVPVDLTVTPSGPAGQVLLLNADLTGATFGLPALGWSKNAGLPGHLQVAAAFDNQGFVGVTGINATAPALDIQGQWQGATLHLSALDIGETVAQGDITPATGGRPWIVNLAGPELSLRAILKPSKGAAAKQAAAVTPGAAPAAGPAWRANLVFSKFRLAKQPAPGLAAFRFVGTGAGAAVLTANGHVMTRTGLPIALVIRPAAGGRHDLRLTATDGGEVLRALGAYDDLQGGALDLHLTYGAGQPVTGVAGLKHFRILQAPAFGKVLQGLTIYGVGEATSGPGLAFDRLIAPFSIATGTLTLNGARAYSSSLGFTASGRIALGDGTTRLDATIIPAYAVNAALGKIPVVGGLFTAETGGGLIAVRATITGTLSDPQVSVNPFSALTPGVLRDVFGTGGAK
jgi:hypothetical protein